ncbi:hypothetical protein DMB44_06560 [Thermoplasma sp. Kam2015]|nr:hypothetical protein DMB44_06560 [Thermoplasma sp. Kam2015]
MVLKTILSKDGEIKLTVDQMLGKLARWIRLMGYDVYYPAGSVPDNEIIERSRSEGRIIITRDYGMYQKYPMSIFEPYDDIDEQLRDFAMHFSPKTRDRFMRCPVCNGRLVKLSTKVPSYVENHRDVYVCTQCHKIYWKGSHYRRIYKRIEKLGPKRR